MILILLAIVFIVLLLIIGSFKSEGNSFTSHFGCEKKKLKGKDMFKSDWR